MTKQVAATSSAGVLPRRGQQHQAQGALRGACRGRGVPRAHGWQAVPCCPPEPAVQEEGQPGQGTPPSLLLQELVVFCSRTCNKRWPSVCPSPYHSQLCRMVLVALVLVVVLGTSVPADLLMSICPGCLGLQAGFDALTSGALQGRRLNSDISIGSAAAPEVAAPAAAISQASGGGELPPAPKGRWGHLHPLGMESASPLLEGELQLMATSHALNPCWQLSWLVGS